MGIPHRAEQRGPVLAIVDSGCTSTALGEDLAHLVHTITEHDPNRKLYIADDTGLDILKVGLSDLQVKGYNMDKLVVESLNSFRTLIVWGMKRRQILLTALTPHLATRRAAASGCSGPRPLAALYVSNM